MRPRDTNVGNLKVIGAGIVSASRLLPSTPMNGVSVQVQGRYVGHHNGPNLQQR